MRVLDEVANRLEAGGSVSFGGITMFFNNRSRGAMVAVSIIFSFYGSGCATAPAPAPEKSRVSLGVQLVRTPVEATRSVTPAKAQTWRPAVGDPDDVDVDEQDELAETLAKQIEPLTHRVSREDPVQGRSIFSDGDVDAESGVN